MSPKLISIGLGSGKSLNLRIKSMHMSFLSTPPHSPLQSKSPLSFISPNSNSHSFLFSYDKWLLDVLLSELFCWINFWASTNLCFNYQLVIVIGWKNSMCSNDPYESTCILWLEHLFEGGLWVRKDNFWNCNCPMTHHVPSFGRSVCHNFIKKGGKLLFHAPYGVLVFPHPGTLCCQWCETFSNSRLTPKRPSSENKGRLYKIN